MFVHTTFKTRMTLILIAVYSLSVINVFCPLVRFSSRTMNMYYMIAVMSIPFVLFGIGVNYRHWYTRSIALCFYSLTSLFSTIVIVFIIYAVTNLSPAQVDTSFQQVNSYDFGAYEVNIYQIKGGALTSFGTTIRQEKKIFFGLLVVRDVFSSENKQDVRILVEPNQVVVNGDSYQLKENVIF
ncbi:MAG: hypothetical protein JXO44_12160 [Clostridia bacterium]|nr:hypothetical protein [Clostridia bacterium]